MTLINQYQTMRTRSSYRKLQQIEPSDKGPLGESKMELEEQSPKPLKKKKTLKNNFVLEQVDPFASSQGSLNSFRASMDTQDPEDFKLDSSQSEIKMDSNESLQQNFKINVSQPSPTYTTHRAEVIDFLFQQSTHQSFKRSTIYLAIHHFDQIMSRNDEYTFTQQKLIALVLLFCMSKVEDIYPIQYQNFPRWVHEYGFGCFIDIEVKAIKMLNWRLTATTPDEKLCTLTHYWDTYLEERPEDGQHSFLLNSKAQFRKNNINSTHLYLQSLTLLDGCIHTSESYYFDPQVLAAAVMYISLKIYLKYINLDQLSQLRSQRRFRLESDFDYFFDRFLRMKSEQNLFNIFLAVKFVSCFYLESIRIRSIPLMSAKHQSYEDLLTNTRYQPTMLSAVKEALENYSSISL